jgi:hypothetical protein
MPGPYHKNQDMKKLPIWLSLAAIVAIVCALLLIGNRAPAPPDIPVRRYSDTVWNGAYDQTAHKYRFDKPHLVQVPVVLGHPVYSIDDARHLVFHLARRGDLHYAPGDSLMMRWRAIDNRGDSCTVEIISYRDNSEQFSIYWPAAACRFHLPSGSVSTMEAEQMRLMKGKVD